MLPSEQLQKYLVRAVTGFGERVQAQDVSEQDLKEAGAKISTLAGTSAYDVFQVLPVSCRRFLVLMLARPYLHRSRCSGLASVSFRKKEQLFGLVGAALELPGAYAEGVAAGGLSAPVKTALVYIQNCRNDIRVRSSDALLGWSGCERSFTNVVFHRDFFLLVQNTKYRTISTRSKAFVERIGDNAAALRLLDIAGFKATSATNSTVTSTPAVVPGAAGEGVLQMVHYNTAILTLLIQVFGVDYVCEMDTTRCCVSWMKCGTGDKFFISLRTSTVW
jgi:hypothetical protein